MAKQTITVKVTITGVRATLAKLKYLPKEASDKLRDESQKLASFLALNAKSAGYAEGRQVGLVAGTIKAVRDRVPSVTMGGSQRLGRNRKPAYGLLFAAEFGMDGRSGWYGASKYGHSAGRQWHPHAGTDGYFFFKTVDRNAGQIDAAWNRVADDVINEFGRGDDG